MRKILVNKTVSDVDIFDAGMTVPADGTYEITPQDHLIWERSADVVTQIASGNIVISDGENILPMKVGIALIQDNQIILNEFYTLVDDEGVLIGNGAILYVEDRFNTTENAPDYPDDVVDEDEPTDGY